MISEVSAQFRRFSQASENNKDVIAARLREWLGVNDRVLEIGSGSGQHAIHITGTMPNIVWQPADMSPYLEDLSFNLHLVTSTQILPPIHLSVADFPDVSGFDAVYSANVLHIMSATLMAKFCHGAARALKPGGQLFVYGPFKYDGEFTTQSNARFEEWLKAQNPESGIRDIELLVSLAANEGLEMLEDVPMPANNQFLRFSKR